MIGENDVVTVTANRILVRQPVQAENYDYNRGWTHGFKAGIWFVITCFALLGAIAVLLVLT